MIAKNPSVKPDGRCRKTPITTLFVSQLLFRYSLLISCLPLLFLQHLKFALKPWKHHLIKLLLKVRPVAMTGRSSISFDVERFLVSVLPELINL